MTGEGNMHNEPGASHSSKNKEVLRKKKYYTMRGVSQRDAKTIWKSSQWLSLEKFEQQNKYNSIILQPEV